MHAAPLPGQVIDISIIEKSFRPRGRFSRRVFLPVSGPRDDNLWFLAQGSAIWSDPSGELLYADLADGSHLSISKIRFDDLDALDAAGRLLRSLQPRDRKENERP